MENRKTIIGIIIVIVLIIALIVASYMYSRFNSKQIEIFTEETNIILQSDIAKTDVNEEIKTKSNYGKVEKAIKEYVAKLKNMYTEIDNINKEINPNNIFSAENLKDKETDKIEEIIKEYEKKNKDYLSEYQKAIEEEQIMKNIENRELKIRKTYFKELYKTVMLSDIMKQQYTNIESNIEKEQEQLNENIEQLEKIKDYLEDNKKYWTIKNEKIQFSNINKMTEYYNLVNKLLD